MVVLQVRCQATQQVMEPIAPCRKYEMWFTIALSAFDRKAPAAPFAITRIVTSASGITFISFDPDAAVPSVKVSAKQPDVLELFEVIEHDDAGIEIRTTRDLKQHQCVLTEVSLPVANALQALDMRGSGGVVVENNTIVNVDSRAVVGISVTGSGDVSLTRHTNLLVGSLKLELFGSGDLQFIAPSVVTINSLETKIANSSDAQAFADSITASCITLQTAGSGDMQIAALRLEALTKLSAIVSSSGSIKIIGKSIRAYAISSSVGSSIDAILVARTELVAATMRVSPSGS